MQLLISTDEQMRAVGARLASLCQPPLIIFLQGDLGAGKTTFVRGFLRGLNFQAAVMSPTYTLIEPYEFTIFTVFHFDLYRVQSENELDNLGLEDYFTSHSICLIEWPERGTSRLPSPDLLCKIVIQGDARIVTFVGHSSAGKKIIADLQ